MTTPTECTRCGCDIRNAADAKEVWPDGKIDYHCEECQSDIRWCCICKEPVDTVDDCCYHIIRLEWGEHTGPGFNYLQGDEAAPLKAAFIDTCTRIPGLAAAVYYGLDRPGEAWSPETRGFSFLHATGGLGPSFLRAGAFHEYKWGLALSDWVHWAENDATEGEQEQAVLAAEVLTTLQPSVPLDDPWMQMVQGWADEWLSSNAVIVEVRA